MQTINENRITAGLLIAVAVAVLLILNPVCMTTITLSDGSSALPDGEPNPQAQTIVVSTVKKTFVEHLLETLGFIEFEPDYEFTRLTPEQIEKLAAEIGQAAVNDRMIAAAVAHLNISNAQKEELKEVIRENFKSKTLSLKTEDNVGLAGKKSNQFEMGLKSLGYAKGNKKKEPDYGKYAKDLAKGKIQSKKVVSAGKKAAAEKKAAVEAEPEPAPGGSNEPPGSAPVKRDEQTEQFVMKVVSRIKGVNAVGKDYSLRFSPKPGDNTVYFVSNVAERPVPAKGAKGKSQTKKIKKLPKFGALSILKGTWSKKGGKLVVENVQPVPGLNNSLKFGFDLYYDAGKLVMLYTSYPSGRMKIFKAVSVDGVTFAEKGPVKSLNKLGKQVGHVSTTNNGRYAVFEVEKVIYIAERSGSGYIKPKALNLSGDSKIDIRVQPDIFQSGDVYFVFYTNIQSGLHAAKLREYEVVGLSKVVFKGKAGKYLTVNQGVADLGQQVFGSANVSAKTGISQSFDIYQIQMTMRKQKVKSIPGI